MKTNDPDVVDVQKNKQTRFSKDMI